MKIKKNNDKKTIITKDMIINGLKFIAENQNLSYQDLKKGLSDLGCTFTVEEAKNQFPVRKKYKYLFEAVNAGELGAGANIVANIYMFDASKKYADEKLLSVDDDKSIYHLIRVLTGDKNYTKDNLSKRTSGSR